MKDMGEANVILGINIKRENKGLSLHNLTILRKYSKSLIVKIVLRTSTRPDIAYVVGRLSRFTSNPSRQHWKAITRVFKYLRGTKDYGLSYVRYPSVLEDIKNLIYEIPIWSKPKVPISIRCDSAPTMAKAYSQVYNGKSRHVGKEAINDQMDSIMDNNTWVLANLPPGCKFIFKRKLKMDMKTTFLNGDLDEEVNMTKEFLSSRFSMKDMEEADVILGIRIKHESNRITISQSYYIEKVLKKFNYFDCTPVRTPMDTSDKLMPNNGQAVSQLEYSRVIGYLMYAKTCTRPDITFDVGKLSKYTTAGKEAEWLKNLLFEISLCSKHIARISIRCDNAATLAKAYSQIYNGKSRHLGVRHSMIRGLITNGVISIEFVRSQ
nr:zinc finger, CCHC-type [Tanacetum cinerariifolium]